MIDYSKFGIRGWGVKLLISNRFILWHSFEPNIFKSNEFSCFLFAFLELTTFIMYIVIKFMYSDKATKFCEIFTFLLFYILPVKSKVKILQNFVGFSKYMKFTKDNLFSIFVNNFLTILISLLTRLYYFVLQCTYRGEGPTLGSCLLSGRQGGNWKVLKISPNFKVIAALKLG